MNFLKTTKQHKKYWEERGGEWEAKYISQEALLHPHRRLIIDLLRSFSWVSLIELGCASGANLVNIVHHLQGKQLGGIDISKEAIELAKKNFSANTFFKVGSAEKIAMSDKSTDVILSDMTLIYVGPHKIKRAVREIKRVGRNYIVLCELNHKSWFKRLQLKWSMGYNSYNWKKLLANEGFYDIGMYKLKEEDWPGGNPQKDFGWIILARIPKF